MKWEEIVSEARFLIVDDEQANIRAMERMLQQVGYRHLTSTTDPKQAVGLYQSARPDLIILDLSMPGLDGFEVMRLIQERIPPLEYLPILVLTADVSEEARLRALLLGAKDFLTKPVNRMETMLRVRILLETRYLFLQLAAQQTHSRPGE